MEKHEFDYRDESRSMAFLKFLGYQNSDAGNKIDNFWTKFAIIWKISFRLWWKRSSQHLWKVKKFEKRQFWKLMALFLALSVYQDAQNETNDFWKEKSSTSRRLSIET